MAMDSEVQASPLRGDGVGSCSSESLEKMYSEL